MDKRLMKWNDVGVPKSTNKIGDGLLEIGEKIEFRRKDSAPDSDWLQGTPQATKQMNNNPSYCVWMMVWLNDECSQFYWDTIWMHDYEFRPIRTKAEREREELINTMCGGVDKSEFASIEWAEHARRVIDSSADAILAKFELKERVN